jgi:hypothetical protein
VKWEYTFYVPEKKVSDEDPRYWTVDFTLEAMNAHGAAGWEAVALHVRSDGTSGAILFKRPLPEEKP